MYFMETHILVLIKRATCMDNSKFNSTLLDNVRSRCICCGQSMGYGSNATNDDNNGDGDNVYINNEEQTVIVRVYLSMVIGESLKNI